MNKVFVFLPLALLLTTSDRLWGDVVPVKPIAFVGEVRASSSYMFRIVVGRIGPVEGLFERYGHEGEYVVYKSKKRRMYLVGSALYDLHTHDEEFSVYSENLPGEPLWAGRGVKEALAVAPEPSDLTDVPIFSAELTIKLGKETIIEPTLLTRKDLIWSHGFKLWHKATGEFKSKIPAQHAYRNLHSNLILYDSFEPEQATRQFHLVLSDLETRALLHLAPVTLKQACSAALSGLWK